MRSQQVKNLKGTFKNRSDFSCWPIRSEPIRTDPILIGSGSDRDRIGSIRCWSLLPTQKRYGNVLQTFDTNSFKIADQPETSKHNIFTGPQLGLISKVNNQQERCMVHFRDIFSVWTVFLTNHTQTHFYSLFYDLGKNAPTFGNLPIFVYNCKIG